MRLDQVKTIGIMGGGVMGGGIAQIMAVAGYDVIVRDLTSELVEVTRDAVFEGRWGMKRAVERGKLSFDQCAEAIGRISFTLAPRDLRDADLIIEAVPERLDLKQQVFAELDTLIKPEAIFTTNTSGFPVADVARDVSEARLPLFAGMHYSNPVPTMKMCEVIYTPQTSQETVDAVKGVAEKAGRAVSMVKDDPGSYGFVMNRVFAAAKREADALVAAGIATREDIDKAMMTGRNWPAAFYGERGGIGKQW
ncbi:MAG: 3-hydroxyacyl-CoA dehydrogenase family protein [Chloroflexi bacterium]|nr:3-hydroxyacyl-CoA dehydrogenase family protein [Chloroflexota bacterium]